LGITGVAREKGKAGDDKDARAKLFVDGQGTEVDNPRSVVMDKTGRIVFVGLDGHQRRIASATLQEIERDSRNTRASSASSGEPKLAKRTSRATTTSDRAAHAPRARSEEGKSHRSGARVFELGRGWGGGGLRRAIVLLANGGRKGLG
jgi:hypothetical protein